MADSIHLEVVTPARAVLKVETDEVIQLPGRDGMFGILPGHAPLMATLGPGVVEYTTGKDGRSRMVVAGGFAIVQDDSVTVLAETAELADEIDLAKAQSALADAKTALSAAAGEADEAEAHDAVTLQESRVEVVAKA